MPAARGRAGTVHRCGNGRPRRLDRSTFDRDRVPRTLAHPRGSADHLRAQREVTIPYRYERTASARELGDRYASLEDSGETGDIVSVAGRLMFRREMGKLAFGSLRD